MTDYWITFRIAEDGHPTRYDALIDEINDIGTGFWDGATSFIAFSSALGIATIGARLKATIAPTKDKFLLREITRDDARHCGVMGEGFGAFFPNSIKL
ncbi:hypothetical protein [Terricaulis sp.]|uniref:hypothetical protein n=1 Tax=Terricaulis sp. TaxID=2768686 RepID=UPI002AC6C6C3|nr:hypothetical protein [Terricaulis sp.]MDZ4690907.1 hypothetical protein [Terricaulis sp.]